METRAIITGVESPNAMRSIAFSVLSTGKRTAEAMTETYDDPRTHEFREGYAATFGGDELPVPVEAVAEDSSVSRSKRESST